MDVIDKPDYRLFRLIYSSRSRAQGVHLSGQNYDLLSAQQCTPLLPPVVLNYPAGCQITMSLYSKSTEGLEMDMNGINKHTCNPNLVSGLSEPYYAILVG